VSTEVKKEIELEIAYVLFIDIVGYSKLLIDQQRRLLELLNRIVRGTDQFRKAEANHRLITIPTGDGMALVFYNTPEAPVECALEISRAVREHPELKLRMGVHSGPVSGVVDVSGRANIAGAGINTAQRVMDCGDTGHILLSKHVAEDLDQYGHWHRHLHDLGEIEVKHGARVSVVNLYTEELGNPEVPQKFRHARQKTAPAFAETRSRGKSWIIAAAVIVMAALAVVGFLLSRRSAPVASGSASPSAPAISSVTAPAAVPVANATAISNKSVAILPFENLSDDKQNAFFTDGVQDEILTDLSKIADLKVISRTSVMQYKTGTQRNLREIAQQLGVAHLVEGSVQRAANKVRVNAQLIDARNDAHLWAQTYDRDLADVFAIQSEIAKAIADQLQAKLSPNEKAAIQERPTANVTAFEEYSRAKSILVNVAFTTTQEKQYLQAIALLKSAVARDPSFYAAYCRLAEAYDNFYALMDHTPERLADAESTLKRVAELRPDSAETHLARAAHFYYALRDYKAALAELDAARGALPNDARVFELTAYILRRQGRYEEALPVLERAVALDPRNQFMLTQLSISYDFLRRYAEEKEVLNRCLEIAPNDASTMCVGGQVDLWWKANPQPLHEVIARLRTDQPAAMADVADSWFISAMATRDQTEGEQALIAVGQNACWGDGAFTLRQHFGEGLLARMAHDEARAHAAFAAARVEQEQLVQKQQSYAPALCVLGLIDAGLGNKDKALEEGRRALQLLPPEKDSINAQRMLAYFGIIAAWVGERDLAIDYLQRAVPTPGASQITSYGTLKLLPFWDPLRGDPRFERIVASLTPKE
jgi:TolB-like protein/class 3 adenylate cyclase/Tfp pilus assembly protein PilF